MSDITASPDVIRLDQRVNTLEAGLKQVVEVVGRIDTKLDERGKTNWGLLAVLAGTALAIVTTIGGLAFSPVNSRLAELSDSVKGFAEKVVTEKELAAVVAANAARRDDAQRQTEARFGREEIDIDALQRSIVPRGEHTEKWAEQRRFDDGIERQVAEVRERMKGFVPTEAIALLSKQVDDLQRRFNESTVRAGR